MYAVPLTSQDLTQDEAAFRITESLEKFVMTTEEVFSRIELRVDAFQRRYENTARRADRVRAKVEKIKQVKKSVTLVAPSRFPPNECVMREAVFPRLDSIWTPPGLKRADGVCDPFTPSLPSQELDIKRSLEDKKRVYCPSQLLLKDKWEEEDKKSKKSEPVPTNLSSVADLFYNETLQLAYDIPGLSTKERRRNSMTTIRTSDSVGTSAPADLSAIGGRRTDEDPLAYRPEAHPFEDVDLPDILPDLPGVAEDVSFLDGNLEFPSSFRDLPSELPMSLPLGLEEAEASTHTPAVEQPSPSQVPVQNLHRPTELPTNDVVVSLPPPRVPTVIPPPAPSSAPVGAPVPPPPPPPPPPTFSSPTPLPATQDSNRVNLMESIRQAGGVGSMRLRKVDKDAVPARKHRDAPSQNSSALPATGGGDLMSALAKALDARRKFISESDTTRVPSDRSGRIDSLIPPPPGGVPGFEDDDDWT